MIVKKSESHVLLGQHYLTYPNCVALPVLVVCSSGCHQTDICDTHALRLVIARICAAFAVRVEP